MREYKKGDAYMKDYQKEIQQIQSQISTHKAKTAEMQQELDRMKAENKETIAQRAAIWKRASGVKTLRTLAIVLGLVLALVGYLALKSYIVAIAALVVMIVLAVVLSSKYNALLAESEPFNKQLDAVDKAEMNLFKEEQKASELEKQVTKLREEERAEKLAQEQRERMAKFAEEHKNTVLVSVKVAFSGGTAKEKDAIFVPSSKSNAIVFIDGQEVGQVQRPYATLMVNPGIHTIKVYYYDDTYNLESSVQQFKVEDDCTMFYYYLGIGIDWAQGGRPVLSNATKVFKDPAEFQKAIGANLT